MDQKFDRRMLCALRGFSFPEDDTEGRFSLEGRKEGCSIAGNIDGVRSQCDNKLLEPGDIDYAGGQGGP